jgi:hypothetical protein
MLNQVVTRATKAHTKDLASAFDLAQKDAVSNLKMRRPAGYAIVKVRSGFVVASPVSECAAGLAIAATYDWHKEAWLIPTKPMFTQDDEL